MNRLQLNKKDFIPQKSDKKIISVLSGKGGVGKSVVVYNLADALTRMGRRVLIVDADVNFGNQHVLANLNIDFGFRQFATGELTLKEATTQITPQISLLASVNTIGLFDEIDIPTVANCINRIRTESTNYDIVLIDHSSGVNKHSSVMAYGSDIVLTILVPELTSISDSYGLFKYLHDINSNLDCRFLVNRAEDSSEAEYIYSKLCAVAERFIESIPKYFGYIKENDDFRKAVASQQTISQVSKSSQSINELNALAHKLLGSEKLNHRFQSIQEINKTAATADIKE